MAVVPATFIRMGVNVIERIRSPAAVVDKKGIPEGCESYIATHDSTFHCDDCLAVALLIQLPQFKDCIVCRTRDQETLNKATIAVDVGGEYNPEKLRFDHHQKSFNEFFDQTWKTATKMSSAGMVWKHFGKDIIKEITGMTDEVNLTWAWKRLYETLFESIDAIDNGVNATPNGIEPLYIIRTDLSTRISRFNLEWTDPTVDYLCADRFTKAVRCAAEEFLDHLHGAVDINIPARDIVRRAINSRGSVHNSGRIIELEKPCPWETHLHEIEEDMGLVSTQSESNNKRTSDQTILFVIHEGFGGDWRVRAVRKSLKSFGNRMDICSKLRGLRDEELAKLAPGVNFVHHAGFLAGCKTKQDAINLIDMTLEEN